MTRHRGVRLLLLAGASALTVGIAGPTAVLCATGGANAAPAGGAQDAGQVRPPAVAGAFYPGDADKLKNAVEGFLRDAVPARVTGVTALVVPHAGYVFSGQVAADAFGQVRGQAVDTVVILGANHTTGGFDRASVYDGSAWRTPLGTVAIDRDLGEALVNAGAGAVWDRRLHEREHSIEVQVPFVQVALPRARILPIVVASQDVAAFSRLGRALAAAVKGRRVLIVASSDLSHYPRALDARRVDAQTLEAIASASGMADIARDEASGLLDAAGAPGLATRACGLAGILVAMRASAELGARRGTVISYANSGDTAVGDSTRTVGYGAVAFSAGPAGADTSALSAPRPDPTTPLDAADKRLLLRLARETIARQLSSETLPLPRGGSPRLLRERAVFVTLTQHGELRGCIGRLLPEGTLIRAVSAMAAEAAFGDPRFPPLTAGELGRTEIEVSVLTPMRSVAGPNDITVGRDGVVLRVGDRSAVFLPQVAPEQGWGRTEMLDHLAAKAGLSASAWRGPQAKFQVFQAEAFKEADFR